MGLEPIALPLSDFSIRKKLESNQRVINDVAACILKLDAGPGFEPGMHRAYETGVVASLPAVFVIVIFVSGNYQTPWEQPILFSLQRSRNMDTGPAYLERVARIELAN